MVALFVVDPVLVLPVLLGIAGAGLAAGMMLTTDATEEGTRPTAIPPILDVAASGAAGMGTALLGRELAPTAAMDVAASGAAGRGTTLLGREFAPAAALDVAASGAAGSVTTLLGRELAPAPVLIDTVGRAPTLARF